MKLSIIVAVWTRDRNIQTLNVNRVVLVKYKVRKSYLTNKKILRRAEGESLKPFGRYYLCFEIVNANNFHSINEKSLF